MRLLMIQSQHECPRKPLAMRFFVSCCCASFHKSAFAIETKGRLFDDELRDGEGGKNR